MGVSNTRHNFAYRRNSLIAKPVQRSMVHNLFIMSLQLQLVFFYFFALTKHNHTTGVSEIAQVAAHVDSTLWFSTLNCTSETNKKLPKLCPRWLCLSVNFLAVDF